MGFHNGFFIIFPIIFLLMFGLVFGLIAATLVKGARQNHKNRNSPRLTTPATVVTKRTHVWGDHSRTDYYATFQFESGDRTELQVPDQEFGYLVEGDRGSLTFQGSRFLSFERT